MQMKLYVNTQGRVLGPIDVERVLALVQSGRIPLDATVSDDRVTWISISELQVLLGKKTKETAPQLMEEPSKQEKARNVNLSSQSGFNLAPPPPMVGMQGYNQMASYSAQPQDGSQGYNLGTPYNTPQMDAPQGYNQVAPYGTAQINNQGMPCIAPTDGRLQQRISMPGAIQGNDVCPVCGQPIVPNASVCQHCGTHFRFCPSCGARVTRLEQVVCTQCGCALSNAVGPINGSAVGVGGISSMQRMNSPISTHDNLKAIIQKSWTTLKWCYVIGLISLFFVGFFDALRRSVTWEIEEIYKAIIILLWLTVLPCVIMGLIAYYRMLKSNWHYVGPKVGNTAGQMAGFLFIPVFHLYWQFEAIWGLAKILEANGKRVNSNIAFSLCFLNCCNVIVALLIQTSLNKDNYLSFLSLVIQIALIVLFFNAHGQINKAIIED